MNCNHCGNKIDSSDGLCHRIGCRENRLINNLKIIDTRLLKICPNCGREYKGVLNNCGYTACEDAVMYPYTTPFKIPIVSMEIKVKKIHKDAIIPQQQYEGDACFDLYAVEDVLVQTNGSTKIRFGITWEMPIGYEGVVRSRSSSFSKKNLNIFVGTIDQQYRGEIMCYVSYIDPPYTLDIPFYMVKKGEAIAQVAFRKVPIFHMKEVDELSETDRGDKGFGSTG